MGIDLSLKTYLVIDDCADVRNMLRSMLTAYGITHLDMASNGEDAIKLLGKHNYDIVLCDYNLGEGKDGQQVLEAAKDKDLIQPSTAFLMVTAENTMERVMGAVEYMPDDYLSKPFNKDMLRNRLEKVIIKKNDLRGISKLLRKGRLADAVALCDDKIAVNPRNLTELLKLKAEILIRLQRYEDAAEIYTNALSSRDVPWALLGLGKVHFHTQNNSEAIKIFQKIIGGNKNNMEAYDWLSKALVKSGDRKEAINILTAAMEISPKSILRQMELADLAIKEKNIDIAVKFLKKAVQIGCNSIYQSPSNYTILAKILSKASEEEALLTLSKLRTDYARDDVAYLHAAITESILLKTFGRDDDAQKSYAEASKLYHKHADSISKDTAMDMAHACMVNGDKDKGLLMLQSVVKNNHGDKELLAEIQEIFASAGLESDGRQMIMGTIKEVVTLNNTGTQLAKSGRLDEAITFFDKAIRNMPDNIIINMNIANVLLMYMKANGKRDDYLYKLRQHLERLARLDPGNANYRKLNASYEKLALS